MTPAPSVGLRTHESDGVAAKQVNGVVVRSFGMTDPGKIRDNNEDQFLIAELARTLWVRQTSLPQPKTHYGRNRGHLFLVADGMGVHNAGEVASAMSVVSMEAFVLHVLHRFSNLEVPDEPSVLKDLQMALRQADERIQDRAAHHPESAGMGTSLTMALASGWKLFVIHAGDSRCYVFRNGKLHRLTTDHTVAAELAQRGVIRPEEVIHNQFRHVVTNILGGTSGGLNRVEVQKTDLAPGDGVLVCTDGLTEMVEDERMAAILAADDEPQAACKRLVEEANAQG